MWVECSTPRGGAGVTFQGNFRERLDQSRQGRSSWFSVLSSRFLVLSSQFSVLSSQFLVLSSRFLVLGSWFLVFGSWFLVLEQPMLLIVRTAQHRYIVRREDVATLRAMTRSGSGDGREDADPSVIAVELGPLIDSSDVSTAQRRHALIIPLRRRNIALLVDAVDTIVDHVDVQPLPQLLRERLHEPWATGVLLINDQPVVQLDVRAIARSILLQRTRAS